MLDATNPSPIPSKRKKHFEHLRQTTIPRFLFRAFHLESSGGRPKALSNPNITVPHAYTASAPVPGFYKTPERDLGRMANAHYVGRHVPLSPFSSWAASLHLVLCYASSLDDVAYVAVMDTQMLDGEVLVWHVPHLMSGAKHEYLAHGVIKGSGYVAVPLQAMAQTGLLNVFTELARRKLYIEAPPAFSFGMELRQHMFEQKYGRPAAEILHKTRVISDLFGELWFPVATALLCVRPWPWFWPDVDQGRSAPARRELQRILRSMKITAKPAWLESQLSWLQHGAVQTTPGAGDSYDFPDVREWIDLLHAIARHFESEETKKRKPEDSTVAAGDERETRSKRRATESNKVGSL
ncbi:hypothetical protein ST47_g6005 [Ascochyta rabiei]|uniref:DUF7587 domain-containing protein n=1 Tax=Didymella rabiei TaxID=5454 RepID=A0A163D206_DIDRA|nr:hypothetical protein ST47_g6005 [Ascochyta rabiei]